MAAADGESFRRRGTRVSRSGRAISEAGDRARCAYGPGDTSAISFAESGAYRLIQEPGTESITVVAKGYQDYVDSIIVTQEGEINKNISLSSLNLSHAIIILQGMAGMQPYASFSYGADMNGDEKMSMEDAIYILQDISALR